MAQIRKRFDLNFGCAKEIAKTCGISYDTAQNIVRYRTSYGQYNTVEELLRVPGLTKSEYKNVAQIFGSMNRNKMPIVAPKVIHTRGADASTTADLVLQGLSINNNSNEVRYRQKSAPAKRITSAHYELRNSAYPSGTLRCGKRYRPPSQFQTPHVISRPATSTNPRTFVNGYKFQNRYTHSAVSSEKLQSTKTRQQQMSQELEHVEIVTPSALNPKKSKKNPPAFTVKTTPCGNKINFSCTFDKKLLQEPTSMAFLLNGPRNRETKSTKCTQSAVYVNATDNKSSEGSVVSHLSQENIILFEKANTPSPSDKKHRISQWVRKVNSDRSVYTSSSNYSTFRTAARSLAQSRDSATIIRRVLNQAPAHIDIEQPAEPNTEKKCTRLLAERAKSPHECSVKKSASKTSITFEEKKTTSKRATTPKSQKSRRKREHNSKKFKKGANETKHTRQRSPSRSRKKRPKSGKRSNRHRSSSRVSSRSERRKYYKYYTKTVRKTDSDSNDGCTLM